MAFKSLTIDEIILVESGVLARMTVSQELKSSRNERPGGNDDCRQLVESNNMRQSWEVWRRLGE